MPTFHTGPSQRDICNKVDRWVSLNLPYIPLSEVEKVVKNNFTGRFKAMLIETDLQGKGENVWMTAWEHFYELMEEALVNMQVKVHSARKPEEDNLRIDEFTDEDIDALLDDIATCGN